MICLIDYDMILTVDDIEAKILYHDVEADLPHHHYEQRYPT